MDRTKQYVAIDLKSFYASVECVERGYDPLEVCLVVADESRTDKTICLAVSPALKAYGVPGRPRLFEVKQKVEQINARRLAASPSRSFTGTSADATELRANPELKLEPIVAPPQMQHYMECSAGIYQTYLKYVAPEDIHVYSIDEVFIDVTPYLNTYKCTARDLAIRMIRDVLDRTGITATVGIGTNLFLCKIAMDIVAKKSPADADGVRIAELDERSYREQLWSHRPLKDFWRVGMGYVARFSLTNAETLYRMFGVNAELLIDHAWGWEPCTMADIKAYRPENRSLSSGQVLSSPYTFEKARLVTMEMTDLLVMDLVEKGLVTDHVTLTVGYDVENLRDPKRRAAYTGQVTFDGFDRPVPKHAHGSADLGGRTSSGRRIMEAVTGIFDAVADPVLLVRRLTLGCSVFEAGAVDAAGESCAQMDIFSLPAQEEKTAGKMSDPERERRRQEAVLAIRRRYGKNAILKGMNFEEGATARDRNNQIGGHRA